MLSSLILIFALGDIVCDLEAPIVQTTLGKVSGVYEKNVDGEHFLYMGIPYARLQPGNIFGDALEALPWEGVFKADVESVKCPQREEFNNTIVGTPECMILNVNRPAVPKTNDPMAVYFFIHGGEFYYGFASRYQWGAEMLTVHDVIVVTINYRTGLFGHMCLDIPEIPGNAGYKDLLIGLNWVKQNIAAFGGDPNRITVGGSSSGAFAVEWLVTSPSSKGLFNKIILESATATSIYWIGSDSKKYVLDVAKEIGFKGELTIQNAWKYLSNQTIGEIIVATEALKLIYAGCVEKEFDGVKRLTIADPKVVIANGKHIPVDVLAGFNNAEGLVVQGGKYFTEQNSEPFENAVNGFIFKNDEEKKYTMDLIRRFYIGDQTLSNKVKRQMINLYSDAAIIYPLYRGTQHYAKYGKVYLYEFTYDGDHNFSKLKHKVELPGASHADEIGYLFRQDPFFASIGKKFNSTDKLIMDYMTTMFTNFVKYGNPTTEISMNTPVIWEPISGRKMNYLVINTELQMKSEPYHDRVAFWELLYHIYYDRPREHIVASCAATSLKHLYIFCLHIVFLFRGI